MKEKGLFYHLSFKIASHPYLVIMGCLISMSIILTGWVFLDFELEPQKLWVSQTSKTNNQQLFFGQTFGAYFRINQLIMRYEDEEKKDDIFFKPFLEKLFETQNNIVSRSIDFKGKMMTMDDFCYKPIIGKGCMVTSPTNYWKDDIQKMRTDSDIKVTAMCLQKEISEDMPCFDKIGTPIQIDAIFGMQGCEGGAPKSDCSVCRKTARSFAATFLLKNDFYTNKVAEQWEKEVFADEVHRFNEREAQAHSGLKMYYMAERSVTDELEIETKENIVVIVVSYSVMFIYIAIMMGEFPSLILSRILVGLGGIFVVILSCLGSFSITSFLGIKQSLISAEVVPFLVLAIGVDNMFIITGARDRFKLMLNKKTEEERKSIDREYTNEEQLAYGVQEVGPSITTAAVGEFLSFLVGYLTDIPALQSFCLCATFAVIINYFLQMTMFVAFVSLDDMRIRSRRYDLFPCIKVKASIKVEHSEGKTTLQKFLSQSYYDFILKPYVKYPALVLYAGLLVLSGVAIALFPLGLNQQTTVVQGNDLFHYFKTQEKYVDIGSPAYIVMYNVDYNNATNLEIIDKMSDHISTLSSVQPPVYSWYKDFQKWMNPYYKDKCNKNLNELKQLPLSTQVREFFKMKVDDKCCTEDAICGEQYSGDIAFNEEGEIIASRFRFQHVPLVNQTIYVDSIIQTHAVSRQYSDLFTLMPGKNKTQNYNLNGKIVDIDSAFPYSLFYVYYDQYLFIRGISIQNLAIGFATIFLAVQLVMNIKAAFVVVLFVFSCVYCLIGVLWLLNFIPDYKIELNAISVVNIVVACGLSVEFCCHIITFYLKNPSKDPQTRMRQSFNNVGVSVLIGIITTKFIGVFVLLFAPSKVFQIYYFRMYFFLILVGFLHGYVLLPLFLTYVNIDKSKKSDTEKISVEEDVINTSRALIK